MEPDELPTDEVPTVSTATLTTYGASSKQLASKQSGSATNSLLIHPSFGCLLGWGEVPKGAPARYPPVNCRASSKITPEARRLVQIPPGVFPPPFNPTVDTTLLNPAPPSKHCMPAPMLPAAPKLRTQHAGVSTSTKPWYRLPAHTQSQRQKMERLYGPGPQDADKLATSGRLKEATEIRAKSAKLPLPPPVRRDLNFYRARRHAPMAN